MVIAAVLPERLRESPLRFVQDPASVFATRHHVELGGTSPDDRVSPL